MKYVVFVMLFTYHALLASEQLLIVISEEFNATTATLQRYELNNRRFQPVGDKINVNLGRSGLGWSQSELNIPHRADEPLKREGDGRAPAGIFFITGSFGYTQHPNKNMPYIQSSPDLICVDDVHSSAYNRIVRHSQAPDAQSFERMRRSDALYALGLTLSHNSRRIPYEGSCVFLHVEKAPHQPTAGCTSMSYTDLNTVVQWLDIRKKPLLIQIPKHYFPEVMKLLDHLKTL